jgi:hypothetical protein
MRFSDAGVDGVAKGLSGDQHTLSTGQSAVAGLGSQVKVAGGGWPTIDALTNNAARAGAGLAALTGHLSSAYDDYHAALVKAGQKYHEADSETAAAARSILSNVNNAIQK